MTDAELAGMKERLKRGDHLDCAESAALIAEVERLLAELEGRKMSKADKLAAVVEAARTASRAIALAGDDMTEAESVALDALDTALVAYDAAPGAPQDAEAREGLMGVLYKTDADGLGNRADAILAYLASQGWRRVGDGT